MKKKRRVMTMQLTLRKANKAFQFSGKYPWVLRGIIMASVLIFFVSLIVLLGSMEAILLWWNKVLSFGDKHPWLLQGIMQGFIASLIVSLNSHSESGNRNWQLMV